MGYATLKCLLDVIVAVHILAITHILKYHCNKTQTCNIWKQYKCKCQYYVFPEMMLWLKSMTV